MKQVIKLVDNGSRSMRVLDALTPLTGVAAPVVKADFLGQVYIDSTTKAVYMSVAVDSVVPANDWQKITEGYAPLFGAAAPAVNAVFLGQVYVETTTGGVYVAVAVDSVVPANDWKELGAAV